jgi:hypothetical protein
MRRLLLPFISFVFMLGGCSTVPPEGPPVPVYGPWVHEGCSLKATARDVVLSTDGSLTAKGDLVMRVQFNKPLVRPPFATLSGAAVPVPIEGAKGAYTLFLPYTPEIGAHMLQPETTLTLTYQPLGLPLLQDVPLPTAPLMVGLGAVGCEP